MDVTTRRDFLKKTAYAAPAIMTLTARPSFAGQGSTRAKPQRQSGRIRQGGVFGGKGIERREQVIEPERSVRPQLGGESRTILRDGQNDW